LGWPTYRSVRTLPMETCGQRAGHKGIGPRGLRVGRHLRYRRQDIDSWLDGLDDGREAGAWRR